MRKTIKIILASLGITLILFVLFAGCFLYQIRYQIQVIDSKYSSDNRYKVELQAIGEPHWPFGSAPGRLILMEGEEIISKTDFEIADDGGPITKNAWKLTWNDNQVEILLFGEEQTDERVVLYFDGRVEAERLQTRFGKPVSERMEDTNSENETTQEISEEEEVDSNQSQMEAGYLAVYEQVSKEGSAAFEICYGASESQSRCIIYEDDSLVKYLVYDRDSKNSRCGLYVQYQSSKDLDGTWRYQDGDILDIYAYVYDTGEVISSGRTHWEDIGCETYQEVTGE